MTFKKKYVGDHHIKHKSEYGAPKSIRFNDEEQHMIDTMSKVWGINNEGTIVKLLMEKGFLSYTGGSTLELESKIVKKAKP